MLSIAAHLPQNAGRISGARIAYGAMGPTPLRAKAVERVLEGRSLDAATIAAAKTAALEGTQPATDAIASEWYRREVLPVHLGRLLAGETAEGTRMAKIPVQFRLNGSDRAVFAEPAETLLMHPPARAR